eukprot:8607689-Alexandrium_andersonii.AAC.1
MRPTARVLGGVLASCLMHCAYNHRPLTATMPCRKASVKAGAFPLRYRPESRLRPASATSDGDAMASTLRSTAA